MTCCSSLIWLKLFVGLFSKLLVSQRFWNFFRQIR
jgi:hypothetical protein